MFKIRLYFIHLAHFWTQCQHSMKVQKYEVKTMMSKLLTHLVNLNFCNIQLTKIWAFYVISQNCNRFSIDSFTIRY